MAPSRHLPPPNPPSSSSRSRWSGGGWGGFRARRAPPGCFPPPRPSRLSCLCSLFSPMTDEGVSHAMNETPAQLGGGFKGADVEAPPQSSTGRKGDAASRPGGGPGIVVEGGGACLFRATPPSVTLPPSPLPKGAHIPMTGPVLTRVRDDPESREFEIYFMLPEAFRGDPPAPTEETVFIERFPELRVFARVFGGWITDTNRLAQLRYLDGQLSAHGHLLQAGRHYTAGYNSPMEILNRRNEVWRVAEGELSCSPTLQE
uniref:Heme-binding protein 2-like n=1 Tax=Podarcis muralis TaxID=64176 RepID=A0A670HRX6_PODMU